MRKALLAAGLALTLAACAALPTPVVRSTGRPVPFASMTAKPRPSRTHRPTRTPEPAETPTAFLAATPEPPLVLTPTVLPTSPFTILTTPALSGSPTPPPAAASALDCKLVWQSPPNGSTYNPREKFSVGWNIRNIGTATWEEGSFEFTYLEGARLNPDGMVPLRANVAPGQSVVLSVPMNAPITPRMYTTYWGIRQGNNFFCRLELTIIVQQ